MKNQIEVKRSIWQIPFSGAAAAFPWHTYQKGIVFSEFAKINQFMAQIDLDNGGWHPGAMERLDDGRWVFRQDWADDMDAWDKRADLMYLRSQDKKYAIGVITNKTVNVYSQSNCSDAFFQSISQNEDDRFFNRIILGSNGNVHSEDQELYLNGMDDGKYYIYYFFPETQENLVSISDGNGPDIKLKGMIEGLPDKFIVLFMARKKGSSWLLQEEELIKELTEGKNLNSKIEEIASEEKNELISNIIVYPVPANDKVIIKTNNIKEEVKFDVLSSEGKLIETITSKNFETELNISLYPKGIYLLKFYSSNDIPKLHKIVKL